MQTTGTRTRVATSYVLLAETVTRDDRGDTVEGSHGLMINDEYVPMDGIVGTHARLILDGAHADTTSIRDWDWEPESLAVSHLGALDYVDWRERDGELIAYAADLGAVEDDEPYVRAIVVRFEDVTDTDEL